MTKTITSISLLTLVLLLGAIFLSITNISFAAAPSGLPSTQTMATSTQVGPQANVTIDPASANCASRIVGTQAQPIMLIFADPTNGDISSTTLSQSRGFIQAASTTVAYDAGIYGCGRMVGYAAASTTITIVENK